MERKFTRRNFLKTVGGAAVGSAALYLGFGQLRAQPAEVKIGSIYPLSGPVGYAGKQSKAAVDLCVDYVNSKWPDLPIPIGEWEGIPNLDGAKLKVIHADHRGEPDRGADLAERLIEDENVVGMYGCYHSSVTKTVSTVCERYGVPMINGESTSPKLTQRGYKWFFRCTPHDRIFLIDLFTFLDGLTKGEVPGVDAVPKEEINELGLCNENTEWGMGIRDVELELTKKHDYNVVSDITYPHESPDLTAEVQKLLSPNPETLLFGSYISDAILLTKTMMQFKANANLFWACDVGFYQPKYIETFGPDIDGILNRTVFSKKLFKVKPVAKVVNKDFKKRAGTDFMGTSARAFTGMQAWALVLNQAGSTDPEAIRKTCEEIKIPGEELIMPWKGINFQDTEVETNQNMWSQGLIVQYQNQEPEIVYPFDLATAEFIYPWPGWG